MIIKINNKDYEFNKGETILDVARRNGIEIPTLCYLKDIIKESNCRICMVETVTPRGNRLVTACSTDAEDGMVVYTNSPSVISSRKNTLELIASNHNGTCFTCYRSGDCYLQGLFEQYNTKGLVKGDMQNHPIDDSSACIVRDPNKCILCGRCKEVCGKVQSVYALTKQKRGFNTLMGAAFNSPMAESECIGCGQCVLVCPTGALIEHSYINEVNKLLADKEKEGYTVIAQVAPSVRVSLAENFGNPIGTFDEVKMCEALKIMGFDKVFDVNYGADLTIIEEGNELLERVTKNENLPLFTSCCPGWFKFVEKFYPDFEHNLSSCKSPGEMLGATIKHYYSVKEGIDINKIKVVNIMPCTAKKNEKLRSDDVDISITTRELAKMIKENCIDYNNLEGMPFDTPLSEYTGAGLIFGVTGGVTEAALRYAITKLDPSIEKIDFEEVRYSEGLKETVVTAGDVKLNIAVANGLANARKIMEQIKSGEKHYDFVEVMACPGGCINGGGQSYVDYTKVDVKDVRKLRTATIYNKDKSMKVRESSKNEALKSIYDEFFINDRKTAHKLLHYRNHD